MSACPPALPNSPHTLKARAFRISQYVVEEAVLIARRARAAALPVMAMLRLESKES